MTKLPFEVADIIRRHGNSFVERNRSWLTWLHLRVLFAIEHCRTAALGGHLDRCLKQLAGEKAFHAFLRPLFR